MLSKLILRAALTAAALTGTAGTASAEEYRVLMMDYAFFPERSYVVPGDVIVFENLSGEARDLHTNNDQWTLESIANGETATLTITEDMPTKYFTLATGGADDEVDENGKVRVVGSMSFDGPPQSADD